MNFYAPSNAPQPRVLVADDDPVARAMLSGPLQERGYAVSEAEDGASAWSYLSEAAPPQIVLLDWMMPRMTGIEVCRRLREMPRRPLAHVVLVTARNRHADMVDGFAAGADDFLVKPLTSCEVVARVQAAERALALATATPGLTAALAEAAASPGGDLLLRSGTEVGRVFFHGGRVAWVHLSSETGSLHDLLRDLPDVRADDVTAVLEECFTAGRHFADVLIEWEIVTAEALEQRLQRWLAAKLQKLMERRHDVVMFVPQQRRYTSSMTFALSELLPTPAGLVEPPALPRLIAPPLEIDAAMRTCLDEAMALDGAQAAALLDSDRGQFLARRGDPLDDGLVHALTRLLHSEDVDDCIDDILVTRGPRLHLLQRTPRTGCYLFVELDRTSSSMGLARSRLQMLARRLGDGA
ncbi:response regulator transcription factor [Nannocystis bainbridge]|uniref:Response regulator n=1 Tax=Nannocystis bainbridge TaxID=2995303 RepID=A0ABT5E3G4_9BACT|nr:response regulator [Nannocystis bainbridge]MDC0720404.1 response regulator [Nannocystis bainbridge]